MKKNFLTIFIALGLFLGSSRIIYAHVEPQMTPQAALEKLKAGNSRFAHGIARGIDVKVKRLKLTEGQQPFATILTCSDSRVPPELVFDQSLGKIFIIRVAGNIVDSAGLGSIEYAAEHLGSNLIIVLGHEACGAVKAAMSGGSLPPNIASITRKIAPAVNKTQSGQTPADRQLATTIENNVREQMHAITANSDDIRAMVTDKKVMIVGGVYHLADGNIEWLGED